VDFEMVRKLVKDLIDVRDKINCENR